MNPDYQNDTTLTMQSLVPEQPVAGLSPFSAHQLHVRETGPVMRPQEHPDWMFGVLVTGFIILSWTLVFFNKRFFTVLSATFSKRHLSQLAREGNLLRERITVSLSALYIISMALLVYQIAVNWFGYHHTVLTGFRLFLIISLLLVLIWALKLFAMNLLGVVFRTLQSNLEYQVNIFLFSALTGLLLLPVLTCSIYLRSDLLLSVCVVITAALFAARFVKGLVIGLHLRRFSYLYLFVYLCALELLPLLLILKLALIYNAF